jgi:(R,R)-butanediol dehydrogenase / meso-butanediol dehydrogenase / diacetyl reductase
MVAMTMTMGRILPRRTSLALLHPCHGRPSLRRRARHGATRTPAECQRRDVRRPDASGLGNVAVMHAALITEQETVELLEFPDPDPREDQIVVDISYCGICGTDVHAYQTPGAAWPSTCGHEWVGIVSKTGAGVTRIGDGDRVIIAVPPACGQCPACHAGQMDKCQTVLLATVGRGPYATPYGGFAPRLAVHHGRALHADPALTDEQAAQIEPATICFHAVRANAPRLGDVAVIQGAGPIGLSTMQWVLTGGAGKVVVVEPSEARRKVAAGLGAHVVVAPGDEAKELIAEHTHGLGADIVYECAGIPATVQSAVDLARRGGRMCLIGLAVGDAAISPREWLTKEIAVTAALGYSHEEFEMAMGYVADGRVDLDALHSGTVSLAELGDALADLASGSSTHTKVLVDPRR